MTKVFAMGRFRGLKVMTVLTLTLAMAFSCDFFELRPDDTLLAKAYDSRLYLSDVQGVIPSGIPAEDSVVMLQRYVDRWLQQQVMAYHALRWLPEEDLNFEQRVQDYRNALIVHAFERELTKQEMDSVVSPEEILHYYEQNKQHLLLKDNVVMANYVKLPLNTPDLRVVRSLYRSNDEQDLLRLEDYCLEHAATYYLGKDQWMVFDDILIDMPLDIDNQAQYLRNNRFVETTDDYYRYFLYIHDYRLKGDISPLEFERDNVRTLILSRRKQAFLQTRRMELFNQAIDNKRIETFY